MFILCVALLQRRLQKTHFFGRHGIRKLGPKMAEPKAIYDEFTTCWSKLKLGRFGHEAVPPCCKNKGGENHIYPTKNRGKSWIHSGCTQVLGPWALHGPGTAAAIARCPYFPLAIVPVPLTADTEEPTFRGLGPLSTWRRRQHRRATDQLAGNTRNMLQFKNLRKFQSLFEYSGFSDRMNQGMLGNDSAGLGDFNSSAMSISDHEESTLQRNV